MKFSDIYLQAAELLSDDVVQFSCDAIMTVDDPYCRNLRARNIFVNLFHPEDKPSDRFVFWKGLFYHNSRNIIKGKKQRVLMLLFMHEIALTCGE